VKGEKEETGTSVFQTKRGESEEKRSNRKLKLIKIGTTGQTGLRRGGRTLV